MNRSQLVVATSAIALGCWIADVRVALVLIVPFAFAVALRMRFIACCLMLCAAMSCSSWLQWRALDRPLPSHVDGAAQLMSDATIAPQQARAMMSIDGRRYDVVAAGETRTTLINAGVGDRFHLQGTTSALGGLSVASMRRKHVAGRIVVTSLTSKSRGSINAVAANELRSLISKGAISLSEVDRSLFTGFVYGDDRTEPSWLVEQFRDSGLSHLVAVSGQNVAFVLAVVAVAVRGGSRTTRALFWAIALGVFGAMTRWEPSVVRAEAMALIAIVLRWSGRKVDPARVLSVGVAMSLVADPFLIGSVGFLLSVSACIGMATLGVRLLARLRGPLLWRGAIAMSVGAQVGVLPVQLVVFGTASTVSLWTNLAVEPAAGLVMTWGITGGVMAGFAEQLGVSGLAVWMHFPSAALLWWIRSVARAGSMVMSIPVASAASAVVSVVGVMAMTRRWRKSAHPDTVNR